MVTATNAGGRVERDRAARHRRPSGRRAARHGRAGARRRPSSSAQTLTADTGTWTGTTPVDFTYQWQRCDADGDDCDDIAGATTTPTRSTDDDLGHTVVVVVTATNDAGIDTATSAPSAVLPAPPVNTAAPSIDGDARARRGR